MPGINPHLGQAMVAGRQNRFSKSVFSSHLGNARIVINVEICIAIVFYR